jgi:hypothetical protein
MPSAIEVQEFSESLYYALDPFDRGFVDLRTSAARLASLAPPVAAFVRRVLANCEDEFEPSEFVFKEDLVGRLIFAVENEYEAITIPEIPKTSLTVLDSPIVSRVPIVATAATSFALEDARRGRRRDVERRKQELVAETLKECTFTPKIGREPMSRRAKSPSPARRDNKVEEAESPRCGAKLAMEVDGNFRKTLRSSGPDLQRLTRPTENLENRGYTRGFLLFRINEADKFHSLMLANSAT